MIHMSNCASFRFAAGRIGLFVALVLILAFLTGCGFNSRINPSFTLEYEEAKQQLVDMSQRPTELQRPVIVLGGWGDPGFVASSISKRMKIATGDQRIIAVNYFGTSGFDESARKTIKLVEKYFPSDDPLQTVEVDVIGFSMGGLVGRYAAMPVTETGEREWRKRLNIRTLYTISSPHKGAKVAWAAWWDKSARDMKPNSDFIKMLANDYQKHERYNIVAYTRLEDMIVGEENAAPDGVELWWVDNRPFQTAHGNSGTDRRFLADIAARLRGEPTFAMGVPAPLPTIKPEYINTPAGPYQNTATVRFAESNQQNSTQNASPLPKTSQKTDSNAPPSISPTTSDSTPSANRFANDKVPTSVETQAKLPVPIPTTANTNSGG